MKRFFVIFLIIIVLIGQAYAENTETKKLKLVCSTTQIADFARQVVGDRCEVKSILKPGADPHTYMPTPGDANLVLMSDICFENGLHLEGKSWMANLAKDAKKPIITCTDGIKPLEISDEGKSIADPHAWFSPKNAVTYVGNIVKAVSQYDPEAALQYQARAKLFLQQLRVLDTWIKLQVNQIPPSKRVLVTSHDAFNYFCREYKFNEKFNYLSLAPVGWSTGSEVGGGMTPKRRKEVIGSIKSFQAPAVFVETSVNPKLIREIAREAGVKIGGLLYSDSMGEADTAGETYIGMMRENTMTIVEALQ